MDIEKMVSVFVKMRDARTQLKKEFDAADASIKSQQDKIQAALLEACKEQNVDGLRTPAGNVYRGIKTRYWTTDWPAIKQFIVEHEALDLMENRLSQAAVKDFLEANPGVDLPGLVIDSKYAITVRRS